MDQDQKNELIKNEVINSVSVKLVLVALGFFLLGGILTLIAVFSQTSSIIYFLPGFLFLLIGLSLTKILYMRSRRITSDINNSTTK